MFILVLTALALAVAGPPGTALADPYLQCEPAPTAGLAAARSTQDRSAAAMILPAFAVRTLRYDYPPLTAKLVDPAAADTWTIDPGPPTPRHPPRL